MATTTTNLGLTKPAYTDAADVAVINDNMDIIDSRVAPLASPTLTGTPTAPTASTATENTQIATTAYVANKVGAMNNKYDFNPVVMEDAMLAVENCSHAKVIVNRSNTAILGGAVPAASILALALNGNATSIATAIKATNTSGLATAGSIEKTIDGVVVKFSRPVLKTVQVAYELRSEVDIDSATLLTALTTAVGNYFQSLNIGDKLDPEQLRQIVMQQLGTTAAPATVVSDVMITGAHGVARNTLVPAYNEKYTLSSYGPVTLTIVRVPRYTVVNGEVCITYKKEVNQ